MKNDSAFDPGGCPIDCLTYRVVTSALEAGLQPPFRLRFRDANEVLFMETIVRIVDSRVQELTVFSGPGTHPFPICCTLTDSKGRETTGSLSNDEANDILNFKLPAESEESSHFSGEVYQAVRQMLVEASLAEMVPPFELEASDLAGKASRRVRIDMNDEGDYQGGMDICSCPELSLPLILNLVDKNGNKISRIVVRPQHQ